MIISRPNGEKPQVEVSTHKATPEELAEWRDSEERWARLRAMRPELIQKYPDKWVALTENGVFLVADSVEELVNKTKEVGARPGFSAREFLNTKPRPRVIL